MKKKLAKVPGHNGTTSRCHQRTAPRKKFSRVCASLSGKLVNHRLHACPTFFQFRCLDQITSPPDDECPRLAESFCTISLHAMTQRPPESLLDLPLHFAFRTVDTCTFNIKKNSCIRRGISRRKSIKQFRLLSTLVPRHGISASFFSQREVARSTPHHLNVLTPKHELLSTIDTTTCNTGLSLQAWSLPRRTNVPDEDEHCGRLLLSPQKVEIGSLTLCSSFAGHFGLLMCQPAPPPK